MDRIQHHRALLGICRQRAQIDGENASFWLEEAAIRERLILLEARRQLLERAKASLRPDEAA